jgi:lipid II:glycine glycyltransferase (peptidoglycan interpeptide bridge formation enzyme)
MQHILQSATWGSFQQLLNKKTVIESNKNYTFLAIKEPTPVGPYFYVPYGPYIAEKTSAKTALDTLEAAAKTENAISIKIEPTGALDTTILAQNGYKKVHYVQPEHTWILDLTPEKSALLSDFKQGTRTRFNTFMKKGIKIEISKNPEDVAKLANFQGKIAKNHGVSLHSADYLLKKLSLPESTLYVAKYEGKTIAASLVMDDAETRYYMHSGSDYEFRNSPAVAAMVATMIFDAKDKGLKYFDFYGAAPDDDENHPWHGFTEFKKSFGGYRHAYLGTWEKPLNPLKYRLYLSLRSTNRSLRKILKK